MKHSPGLFYDDCEINKKQRISNEKCQRFGMTCTLVHWLQVISHGEGKEITCSKETTAMIGESSWKSMR